MYVYNADMSNLTLFYRPVSKNLCSTTLEHWKVFVSNFYICIGTYLVRYTQGSMDLNKTFSIDDMMCLLSI